MQLSTKEECLAITTLGGGAVLHKAQIELNKILDNILDPNTVLSKRTLNIKVGFKPNQDRDMVDIDIDCSCTLAKDEPITSKAMIGKDIRGNAEAHEIVRQEQMEFDDNVVGMTGKGGGK